jgi:hypothetical protein
MSVLLTMMIKIPLYLLSVTLFIVTIPLIIPQAFWIIFKMSIGSDDFSDPIPFVVSGFINDIIKSF